MKKTLSIHIGKQLFTIEEDAFALLKSYLDRLAIAFQNEQGKEEIIEDIEFRFAELFQSYLQNSRVVVEETDVKLAIESLGEIENFETEEQTVHSNAQESTKDSDADATNQKRLFRDTDNRVLGGVCSGLAQYFKIDVVFIRIIFILSLLVGFGFGLYLVLWIVFPSIKSPADRLQMQGKPVTVETIKDEFTKAGERIKKDTKNLDKRLRNQAEELRSRVNPAVRKIKNLIGIFIVAASLIYLLFTTLISTGMLDIIPANGEEYYISLYEFLSYLIGIPRYLNFIWIGGIIAVYCIGFFWLIIGTRMLTNNNTKTLRYSLIASILVGIIGTSIAFIGGVQTSRDFSKYREIEKNSFHINSNELKIELLPTFYRSHRVSDEGGIDFLEMKNGRFIESGISFKFIQSKDSAFHITQAFSSLGISNTIASNRALNIEHKIKINQNKALVEPNYSFPINDAIRKQRVEVIVEIPTGKKCWFGNQEVRVNSEAKEGYLEDDSDNSFQIYSESY